MTSLDERSLKILISSWDTAIGTLLSALGNSPMINLTKDEQNNLELVGNLMQGTGSGLGADLATRPLSRHAEIIQAIGNSALVASLLLDLQKEEQIKLVINGEFFQAIGSSLSLYYFFNGEESDSLFNLYGPLLQTIGNSLQGVAEVLLLKGLESKNLLFVGSWIQTIGAFLSAYKDSKEVLTKESERKGNFATVEHFKFENYFIFNNKSLTER